MSDASQAGQASILTSWSAIEVIRQEWKALCCSYYADPDYIETVISSRRYFVRPHVFALRSGNSCSGLVVGWIETRALRFWDNYGKQIKMLVIPAGGVLAIESDGQCEAILRLIRQGLESRDFDVVMFGPQSRASVVVRAFLEGTPFWARECFVPSAIRWTAQLKATGEEFLKAHVSSKHRSSMRRMRRKLDAQFPGRVRLQSYSNPADADDLINAAVTVSRNTYQWRMGGGLAKLDEKRDMITFAARQDWLRGYVLHVQDRPVAFWIGTLYKNTFRLDVTGYLEQFKAQEPGTMVLLHAIDELCKEQVATLDFGWSDVFYKSRLGDERNEESSLCVCRYAPWVCSLMAWKSGLNLNRAILKRITVQCDLDNPLRKLRRRVAW